MPIIAIVEGVRVMIYTKDHLPPHLHARFAEFEALISIVTGDVLEGKLPTAKLKAVKSWLDLHRAEVSFVWEEIRAHRYTGGLIR